MKIPMKRSKQDLEEKEELQVSIYTNKQYKKSAHGTVLILCSVFSPCTEQAKI